VPDRQDLDPRDTVAEPVQGNESGPPARNHEFADVASHGAADQRVVAQDAGRIGDALRGAARAGRVVFGDEVD
jgi:hypothetical protein